MLTWCPNRIYNHDGGVVVDQESPSPRVRRNAPDQARFSAPELRDEGVGRSVWDGPRPVSGQRPEEPAGVADREPERRGRPGYLVALLSARREETDFAKNAATRCIRITWTFSTYP